MSLSYRCSKANCRKRASFIKPLSAYKRVKYCPGCGRDSLKRDIAHDQESRRNTCHCDGYAFPHRHGSKWCNFSTVQLDESDYQERYYSMETMQ